MSQTPASEAARRRTFAIISHPDAGKTTLTEHLLLLGGAIHAAGRVKARGEARRAKSDWMKIEQERGISVTSAVMTFEYQDAVFNLLDTPGHEDFSEDTYRTLTAADQRGDGDRRRQGHRGADPQIVRSLPPARHSHHDLRQQDGPRGARSLRVAGRDFRPAAARNRADGVAGGHGAEFQRRATILRPTNSCRSAATAAIGHNAIAAVLDPELKAKLDEDVSLAREGLPRFDLATYREGHLSPVYFGSALKNFGVRGIAGCAGRACAAAARPGGDGPRRASRR